MRFGRYELLIEERQLRRDGEPVALGSRALDLLAMLAEHPGQLMTRQALMDRVWRGRVVEDGNLSVQINTLRQLLGGAVIVTVPGFGYRFQAGMAVGQAAAPPALAAGTAPDADVLPKLRTNMPAVLPLLLGRDDELAALGHWVDTHGLVTLAGPGGVGKTRLARALLHGRRQHYPGGVCWVELCSVTDTANLPSAIASALGLPLGAGDPLAALCQALAPLTLLLALDNAEHLLAGVAHVAQALHGAAPGLRLLVTSQAPLRLPSERVMRLAPLAVPAQPLPAQEALAFGAVALFAERARAADSRFVLDDASAPSVISLCRALDGLPLAIELAAARAPWLGLTTMLASINQRLKLLTSSRDRAAPARQQTLRATLSWSHDLLDPREQLVFRRLGVVAGSASLALAQQLARDDADGLDEWAVLDALELLIDRSLVSVLPGAADGLPGDGPRYRLLDSARAFALEQLAAAGELALVKRRHMLAMAEDLYALWDDAPQDENHLEAQERRVALDFDNARDAMATARDLGDATAALKIGSTLARLMTSVSAEERKALTLHLEALVSPDLPLRLQCRVWLGVCHQRTLIRPLRTRPSAQRALALARQLDAAAPDRVQLYTALGHEALSALGEGEVDAARHALAEMRGLEDPHWPPQRRFALAHAEIQLATRSPRRDAVEELRLSRRAVSLARGSRRWWAMVSLMDSELFAGDAPAAVRIGQEALAALTGTRHDGLLAWVRQNLAVALLALGRTAEARPIAQAGWPQAARVHLQPSWLDCLAQLTALESRPEAAALLIGCGDARYRLAEHARSGNEAQAMQQALALATAALGDAAVQRLRAEGEELRDEDIPALAFAAAPDQPAQAPR